MPSLYRSEKDGENIGIIVENKYINGLEINLECVIITFNHVWKKGKGIKDDD